MNRSAERPLPGHRARCRHCRMPYVVGASGEGGGGGYMVVSDASSGRIDNDDTNAAAGGAAAASSSSLGGAGVGSSRVGVGGPCRDRTEHEPDVVLKDNDFTQKIRLRPEKAIDLIRRLEDDADFLKSQGIMDYSLLIGQLILLLRTQAVNRQLVSCRIEFLQSS